MKSSVLEILNFATFLALSVVCSILLSEIIKMAKLFLVQMFFMFWIMLAQIVHKLPVLYNNDDFCAKEYG